MLELNKTNFEAEVLQAEGKVIVDYWSPSCEPCKALMPKFTEFAETYGDKMKFAKLDTSKARRVAIGQKVLGLPTIAVYSNGEKVAEVTKDGATADAIEAMIKENL